MKRLILFFILLSSTAFAQDASFTNYHQSLIYSNASFAGSSGLVRNQSAYSMQRATGFNTAISSIDGFIKPINAGVAVTAFSDDMGNGTLRNSNISLSYAQYIHLKNKMRFVPSLQVSMGTMTLDKTKLNFGDLINPRYGERWNNASILPAQQKNYMNIGAGLLYSRFGNYAGIYFNNINQPDVGLSRTLKLPMRTSIYLSGNLLNDFNLINISLMGNFQPGSFNLLLKYTEAISRHIVFGVGYASAGKGGNYGQGFVANCGLRYKIFTLMYGFNQLYLVNSDLKPQPGSHEVSLSISLHRKENSMSRLFRGYLETW
jgi:type IX secretion system PorP/SprF family membrane protein